MAQMPVSADSNPAGVTLPPHLAELAERFYRLAPAEQAVVRAELARSLRGRGWARRTARRLLALVR